MLRDIHRMATARRLQLSLSFFGYVQSVSTILDYMYHIVPEGITCSLVAWYILEYIHKRQIIGPRLSKMGKVCDESLSILCTIGQAKFVTRSLDLGYSARKE